MSDIVSWIAAEREVFSPQRAQRSTEESSGGKQPEMQQLAAHNFGSPQAVARIGEQEEDLPSGAGAVPFPKTFAHPVAKNATRVGQPIGSWEYERERRVYRGRTVAMLRRYMRYSLETGRLPSLVGREFFRSNVTKYRVATFEDRVIFVHDMERCLGRLDEFARAVLGRIVLQEYEHDEAARMFGCTRMTVHRKLLEALDQLSDILLEVELLDGLSPQAEKCCQEGKVDDFLLSGCEDEK